MLRTRVSLIGTFPEGTMLDGFVFLPLAEMFTRLLHSWVLALPGQMLPHKKVQFSACSWRRAAQQACAVL